MGKRKWLASLLSLFLVTSLALAGCGSTETAQQGGQSSGGDAKSSEPQILTVQIRSEPPSLSPTKATDSVSGEILNHLMEGLTRLNDKGEPIPGIAEKWEVSNDGLTYTFHLRKDAKWSDGQPVTAHDFVYAWLKLLDPNSAADYAYQLFYLKNGEAYNQGKVKAEDVGVKALDDYTLQVQLEKPTPYFLSLCAYKSLFPIPKHVDEKNPNWHAEASTYVSNGPFVLAEWAHDSKVVLKKNEHYYAKDEIKLEQINFLMINDRNTAYQMFETGQLDALEDNSIPNDLLKQLIDEGKAKVMPYFGTYYYVFNTKDKIFSNAKIRKAFALAIDRQAIVETITQGGQKPALAFVPPGAQGANGDFREEGGTYFKDNDVETAKKLLQEGLTELGLSKLPPVELKYNTDEGHQKIAEAIQQMWKQNLGVEVKLSNQEWKVYLDSIDHGRFQVGRMGWIGDYVDAMTFLDLFVTGGGNNYPKWSNKQYDELIAKAKSSNDQAERAKYMHEAEKILMDEMPIAPIYFYTRQVLEKDYVKGAVRVLLGEPDYTRAWIEGKQQ
ncbi:MAG: peptide ABC transporter substrate-binding protein [Calditerricola sp.]|nr:peptide ABC transporter substrate-binding protein [Calditerricola sp.]